MKSKIEMARELNGLLSLSVDWSRLKLGDLQEVHKALTEDMTLSQALNLNAASLRLRIGSMPILQLLRERAELSRRYYQRQTLQSPNKDSAPLMDQKSTQPQSPERKRQCYIS